MRRIQQPVFRAQVRRWLRCAGLWFCLSVGLPAGEPLPLEQLAALPRFDDPKLSPDGTRLCVITRKGASQSLVEIGLNGSQLREVAVFNKHARLRDFWWKNAGLILLQVEDENGATAFQSVNLATGKILFDLDPLYQRHQLLSLLAADPDSVLIQYASASRSQSVAKLNLRTGHLTGVKLGSLPSAVGSWLVNKDGDAVAGLGDSGEKSYYLWRAGPGEAWQRRELGRSDQPELILVSVHPDQRQLIAWDYTGPGPAKVVALDPATQEKAIIFSHPEVQADSVVAWGDNWAMPRAIEYERERPERQFLDPEARLIQKSVDAALPATVNEVQSVSVDGQVIIILAWSDRDRGGYFILDRAQKRIVPVGRRYAGSEPDELAASRRFEFSTRDGLVLHGRLTLPSLPAAGKPPLVVLTGSWFAPTRVKLEFSPLEQALATRGYVVARLETRGTYGYDRALLRAGDYQMDSGIPNDLADGTKWLIQQGSVDPARVALAGEQWGGVIAIQVLAQNPGLFSLWLNFDTPVDLRYLDVDSLVLSTSDVHLVAPELGGRRAGEKILKRLDPTDLIPKIALPSFHYYKGFGGSYYAAASDMRKLLKKGAADFELSDNHIPTTRTVEEREEFLQRRSLESAEQFFAFLAKHFKP